MNVGKRSFQNSPIKFGHLGSRLPRLMKIRASVAAFAVFRRGHEFALGKSITNYCSSVLSNRAHLYQGSPLSGHPCIRPKETQQVACRTIKSGGRTLVVPGRDGQDFHGGRICRRKGKATMLGKFGRVNPVRLCIAAEMAGAGWRQGAALRGNFLQCENVFC